MIDIARHQREYLETVKLDVLSDLNSRGMNATGNLKQSLRVVENQYLRAQLRGADYLNYLISMNNSKRPRSRGRTFIDNIITWMKARGIRPQRENKIVPATNTNYRRSAFAIAGGIMTKGTKYQKPPPQERGIDLRGHLKDNLPPYLEGITRELLINFKDRSE